MIEIVYKDDAEEDGKGRTVKTPKNVKQIGDGKGKRKIYIEDYVMNFVKRAPDTENEPANIKYGVLLGKVQRGEGTSFLFVQGAAEAAVQPAPEQEQGENTSETELFSGDAWNGIYDDIKRYFDHLEIVGWYLSKSEQQSREMPWINKVHLDNFSGMDKLFLAIDRSEKEEVFYAFDGTGLEKEEGYYIYYDRNEEMQQYMASREPLPEIKNDSEEKPKKTVSFSVSSLLAVAALLAVVLLLNNYDGIAGLLGKESGNSQLSQESGAAVEEAGNKVEQPAAAASEGTTKIPGETQGGTTETATGSSGAEAESQTAESGETETKAASTGLDTRYYTVQPGETLYEICMRVYNNASMVDTVREVNGLDENYLIIEGQKIILP